MATITNPMRETLTIHQCAGCRTIDRVQVTNYVESEAESFEGLIVMHRVFCATCTGGDDSGLFSAYAGNRAESVKRWNRLQNENHLEELQYERERKAHDDAFNAVYASDPESRV